MSTNFAANFSESYMLNMSKDLIMNAAKSALNNLGWQYKVISPIEIEAKTGMSVWSFGEKIYVRTYAVGRSK